jgi:spore maturation protein CgeB/ubiquinone/menaquinone biosynthesis C-methylase UbiE
VGATDRITEAYRGERGTPKAQERERTRIDWLASTARGEVLDLVCGSGIVATLCARRGLRALGVDADETRVGEALADRAQKPPAVHALLDFRVGDPANLDLADDSFDTVVLARTAERLEDFDAILADAARVTRPGGLIALTVPFGREARRSQARAFYPVSLVDALAPHVTVKSLDLEDGYFRVTASPGAMSGDARQRAILDLQPSVEAILDDTDQDLALVRERRRRLAHAVRRLDRSSRRARWRLAVIRATHWWRLGKKLSVFLPRRLLFGTGRRLPPREPGGGWRERDDSSQATVHAELNAGADHRLEVEIPSVALPDGPVARPDLTVAVILDHFSATSLRYEWNQVQVGPDDWREALDRERPELLFVESAWRGNNGRWFDLLKGRSRVKREPLIDLLESCRERGIPTVFWNKEDPPNFRHFVHTAELFDHVFTVDGDCVHRYAEVLGREDVKVLPFGAQPRIHNPVSVPGGRRHDVVFAGTYFPRKHPVRRKQMETILAPALDFDLHIFSRIIQGEDDRFQWPPEYARHVVGSLPYERMLAAYKAYKVFLNVNSVTTSPTMCARRVFELSACSTAVLSGYSRAIEAVFGDLISVARTSEETRAKLESLLDDPEERQRRAHEAMREVLGKHTYGHRVDEVLRVTGVASPTGARRISVLLAPGDEPPERAVEQICRQVWRPLQAVVVLQGPEDADAVTRRLAAAGIDDATVLSDPAGSLGAALNAALAAANGDLIALFDPSAEYGEHYVGDLAHAFSYSDAGVVGKGAHHAATQGGPPELRRADAEHVYTEELEPETLMVRGDVLRRLRFDPEAEVPAADLVCRAAAAGVRAYAADRHSFVALPAGFRARA